MNGPSIRKVRRTALSPEQLKGARNEQRAVDSLQVEWDKPEWFLYCRTATLEEDQDGIDAVIVTTDVGELYLQVKSSSVYRRKFLSRERRRDVRRPLFVVVVLPEDTFKDIRNKIIDGIARVRSHIRIQERLKNPVAVYQEIQASVSGGHVRKIRPSSRK